MVTLLGKAPRLWSLFILLALHLPTPIVAPIPCSSNLLAPVTVGDVSGLIGTSQTIDSRTQQARFCVIINYRYEGYIIISCLEGAITADSSGCSPRRCFPDNSSTSVNIGGKTVGVNPLEIMQHNTTEVRLCRNLNPQYRGHFILFCIYGELSTDISDCVTQWDPMDPPPWVPRGRHSAVGLSDGSLLMIGGLAGTGPLNEVWQWRPDPTALNGTWQQMRTPPWTARYGGVTVQQVRELGEQVMFMAGNDGVNQRDVWRWLRDSSELSLLLQDGVPSGSQAQDCMMTLDMDELLCTASDGVVGRRWFLPWDLQDSTEVIIEFRYTPGDGIASAGVQDPGVTWTAAIVALQLDDCRQLFRALDGDWSTEGCTGTDPPWARAEAPQVVLGDPDPSQAGQWRTLRLVLDRVLKQVILYLDDVPQAPRQARPADPLGVPVGGGLCGAFYDKFADPSTCTAAPPVSTMSLRSIELAVWPNATLEIRKLAVLTPPDYWQLLAPEPPWEPRSLPAAVALPDGDVLMFGGLGNSGMLSDVWRWTPSACTLLPNLDLYEATKFNLECTYTCRSSVPYGQWIRLLDAPWDPRQEHAAIWTSLGLLMVGGRSIHGFERDVWRWTYSGNFCSNEWKGRWFRITAASSWQGRQGHSLVGFGRPGVLGAVTVLIIGGFGGKPVRMSVDGTPQQDVVSSLGDVWCGNQVLSNFTVWNELVPHSPFTQRAQAATVVAPTFGSYNLVFFGGYDITSRLVEDMWRWSGENATVDCRIDQP